MRSRRLRVVAVAITLLAALSVGAVTQAADLIYPLTGSTKLHDFRWRAFSAPDGLAHTDYYLIQTMPYFGPQVWTERPEHLAFEDVCVAWTTRLGPATWCQIAINDRKVKVCARPCNAGFGCGLCYSEQEWDIIRCCHEQDGSSTCYAGLAKPPANCS